MKHMDIAIIGGDKRMVLLGGIIEDRGGTVYRIGQGRAVTAEDIEEIEQSDMSILPMPCTTDGRSINAPLCEKNIEFSERIIAALKNKPVFAGMAQRIPDNIRDCLMLYDYGSREDYLLLNAQATAEAAAALAVKLSPYTLFGSRLIITGFGRIGKALVRIFTALGAEVTVCARRAEHFALARCMGTGFAAYEKLPELAEKCAILINTVPAPVITAEVIERMNENQVIIDLASGKGGTDFKYAADRGIKAEHALALPGMYSPYSAAMFIADTVETMIKEGI